MFCFPLELVLTNHIFIYCPRTDNNFVQLRRSLGHYDKGLSFIKLHLLWLCFKYILCLTQQYLTQLYVFTPLLLIVFPEDDTIEVIAW